ncbi:hypothetical protein M409DRAFT_62844 [Zasmidium cellare ATCC 36951]|uniref:Ribosomal protein/NADH dehydrogenase domain-containing protein n=1 Tax=Zasmidium cellare ATCC 36951 TaxID=1080233 RepID=A0A6A6D2I7_ZASCE|nr:uncharacterized protein M409DRAFT_62844 [Zasmidium cellare ATCC 36951]KAF2173303.1 hypothetical protein M409DRAFT_62844 [Zasmidium cellare ATCC 36951]
MVSLSQRMRKLQTKLLAIRLGPGAVVLPKEVKRIHLRFAPKINGGHMGPRRFWRQELIRLKYHNPAVAMTVDRDIEQTDPATMSVHFAPEDASQTSGSATASSAPSTQTERVETINMKNYTNSEILDALVQLTKAYPVEPTPEEREELAKLEEQRRKSEKDSKLSQEVRARVKREKELLEQARGDVATQAA